MHRAGPVGAQGLELGQHVEREGGSSGGSWGGALASKFVQHARPAGSRAVLHRSDGGGSGGGSDVFSAGAFADNFGRRPAAGSAARLGAEEGGDLGTAYALDDYDRP